MDSGQGVKVLALSCQLPANLPPPLPTSTAQKSLQHTILLIYYSRITFEYNFKSTFCQFLERYHLKITVTLQYNIY
jgi:hypothetical protein